MIFLSRVTLKFDGWPWKSIGHLFYVASSLVHHFIAISELKPKLQSGNAKFRSKSAIFWSHVILKLDGWPWKTIHLFYATSSFLHHFIGIGQYSYSLESPTLGKNWRFLVPCDLEIWQMTLENNRAPHLTYLKLCASFCSHRSIQTVVTVRKRQIWVKIAIFCPLWPWNLTDELEKQ